MTKLEKFIEVKTLEKENRNNRLDNKLRQQEYNAEIEELFDPLIKTLNTHNELTLTLGEQTLRANDWQVQELDKQTKAIHETGSQTHEATRETTREKDRLY